MHAHMNMFCLYFTQMYNKYYNDNNEKNGILRDQKYKKMCILLYVIYVWINIYIFFLILKIVINSRLIIFFFAED